jgi:hypothetical protein
MAERARSRRTPAACRVTMGCVWRGSRWMTGGWYTADSTRERRGEGGGGGGGGGVGAGGGGGAVERRP